MIGKIFSKLTVIGADGSGKRGKMWLCRCECGKEKSFPTSHLNRPGNKSCGCVKPSGMPPVHGMSHSTEYKVWSSMVQRCTNKNADNYKRYGGRGITVSEEWKSFDNFYKDMGPRPPGTTLDRKDNDGNYCIGNCSWETSVVQQRNKRNNVLLELDGVSVTVSEWAERTGIDRSVIYERIKAGWSVRDSLTKPVK